MSDYPIAELDNKTPLQAASKPNMNAIAAKGRSGLIRNVPDECTPGSDTAICSVLGYDPRIYNTGRGPLEVPSRGIDLGPNDSAFRCNLITEEKQAIADYSAGHISTEEAAELIAAIKKVYHHKGKIEFYVGLDYRHFLILRDFPHPEEIQCVPPHDARGLPISDVLPKATTERAEKDARMLQDMIVGSREILREHPVNIAREMEAKNPGNLIWFWGGGKKPSMPTIKEKYGVESAVISAVDLVKGIGSYAGMEIITVEGATGLFDTNYEGKADAAIEALKTKDLVFVHVEAPDEAGHVGDVKLKVKTIEDLDRRCIGRIMDGMTEPYAIAVLPDHSTPIELRTHSRDPVPFAISAPGLKPDGVEKYDEMSAKKGSYGLVENKYLISLLLSIK